MSDCINHCRMCWQRCTETTQHCLKMGGKHAEQSHIALMLTCARMCATSAEAMMLGTAQHKETCRACAAICRACAADCRRIGQGDETLENCAVTCDQCAASCERMAASM
jgi:hypothetical protein